MIIKNYGDYKPREERRIMTKGERTREDKDDTRRDHLRYVKRKRERRTKEVERPRRREAEKRTIKI